jgi:ADP-heptose:LPS heptosyltransferase
LKDENYDVAVCYDSGMYLSPLRLAVDLQIPNRVGYTHKGFSAWVTHPIPIRYPQPFPAYFRDLVAHLTGRPGGWALRPLVYPTQSDEATALDYVLANELDAKRPILACFPTTRQPGAQAASEKLLEILQSIEEQRPELQTLLLGSPSDIKLLADYKRRFGLRVRVPQNSLSLLSLAALLQQCTAVLCLDSGPRHLANPSGTRTFFIRNLVSEAIETGRYLDSERDLFGERNSDFNAMDCAARYLTLDAATCAGLVVADIPNE